jgi:hypothetical protein
LHTLSNLDGWGSASSCHFSLDASYGPVYGILGGDGQSLFIADAVNEKNYFFNLAEDPGGTRNRLTDAIRGENEKLIHDLVVSVNQFYGLGEIPVSLQSRYPLDTTR